MPNEPNDPDPKREPEEVPAAPSHQAVAQQGNPSRSPRGASDRVFNVLIAIALAYSGFLGLATFQMNGKLSSIDSQLAGIKASLDGGENPLSLTRLALRNAQLIKATGEILFSLICDLHCDDDDEREVVRKRQDEYSQGTVSTVALLNPLRPLNSQIKPSDHAPGKFAFTLPGDGDNELEAVYLMAAGDVTQVSPGEGEVDKGFWTVEVLDKFGNRYRYEHLAQADVKVGGHLDVSTKFGSAKRASPVCVRAGVYLPGSETPIDFRPLLGPLAPRSGVERDDN